MAPHCHRSLFFLKPAAKLSLHTIVPPWVTLHVRQTQKSRRLLSPLAKLPSLGNASFLCVVLVGLTTTFHSATNLPFTARQTHPHPLSADASSLGHPALPRTDATRGNFVLGIQDFSPDGTLQPPGIHSEPGERFSGLQTTAVISLLCLLCSLLQALLPKTTLFPCTFTWPQPQTMTPRRCTHRPASLEMLAGGHCQEPHGSKLEPRDVTAP